MKEILYFTDLLGTMVFAISGALAVKGRQIDVLGASFTAFITAIGGGTLRDVLLNSYPLVWVGDTNFLLAIGRGIALSFLFYRKLARLRKTLMLFDSLGIALFTVLGTEKALRLGVDPAIAAIMGMFSAVMGGVIRDTLTNRTPVLFRKEIYASPCLAGAVLYLTLDAQGFTRELIFGLSIGFIALTRLLAVHYAWVLPRFERRPD